MANKEETEVEKGREASEVEASVAGVDSSAIEVEEGSLGSGAEKSPEEVLLEMKAKLEEERRARAAAEAEAAKLRDSSEKARAVASNAYERAYIEAERRLDASIAAASGFINDLKRQYKEAYDSGDSEKMLEINDKLVEAKIDLRGLVVQKEALAHERERVSNLALQRGQEDRFYIADEYIEKLSKPTRDWIAKHPEFRTDEKFYRRAMRYHFEAIDDHNLIPDTPEYFDFIDRKLGFKDDKEKEREKDIRSGGVRTSEIGVPHARFSGGGDESRYIRLSEEEKEIADMMGMSYARYAEHKRKLIEEGKIGGKR